MATVGPHLENFQRELLQVQVLAPTTVDLSFLM